MIFAYVRGSLELIVPDPVLSSDETPSDPSLVDVTDDSDIPDNAQIDDYGYESDSDLDDSDDPVPDVSKSLSAAASTFTSEATAGNPAKDDEECGLSSPVWFLTDAP